MNAKDLIRAGKYILLWRKIYNRLCRTCRMKLVSNGQKTSNNSQEFFDNNKEIVKNKFCVKCTNMIKEYEVKFK